ncbi:Down syndrome cell adhesion molecule-like protein Dscam2 isoform X1 [Vespula pensylvanica]|uniref:Down syndrome cell adhesion molecule-like protein Dscam2 isoform X1 n=1 Tax=Vespula pensylvanica TaxID=30213 RepID=UPI001CBA46F8|nr:Down syndrome cell adhesion molecule-like protein Dscam2 isoform X1 [Vespula pensylvanica]XP_043669466.1 Down syndrome cell adhesion molecule-like protein Dscam2 isoform X1 [Vespula pensylvanica]
MKFVRGILRRVWKVTPSHVERHNLVFSTRLLFILLLVTGCNASYEMQGPSFVSEPPSRVEFTNVNGGRVDCTVRGNPAPTVDWLGADGGSITNIPGIRHVLGNGTIHFPGFEAEAFRQDVHWAIYKCSAANSVGAVVSRDVTVRAVVNQPYDPEVQSPGGFLGNNVLMRCNVPSFVRDHVTVTSWFQEPAFNIYPTPISDGKYHMLPSGELMIINITRTDAQMTYRCRTHHRLTQETVVSSNAGRPQLTELRGSMPPIINEKLVYKSVRLKDTVVIPCVAYANPTPTNRWYYNRNQREEPIEDTSGHYIVRDGSLIIQGVQENDAGSYMCIASNSEGTETLEVRLTVSAPLSVLVQPAIQTVDLGKPAHLTCSASGFPQAALYWLKDGQPLRMAGRVSTVSRERISVTSVAREDRGMYQCFVRNEYETAQGIAELRLGEIAPQLVYRFIEQTMQPGPSVSLKCSAAGNPTPQISWLLDGFPLPQNDRLLIGQYVTVYGDVISHVNITSVKPEDGGEYECTASSRAGDSKHSARLNIYGLPYVRPMSTVSAVAGKQLYIKCPVAGYPIESIVWEKGNVRLPTNMRQRVANGTLFIDTVQRAADQGIYTCTARNKHNITSQRSVEVRVLVPPKITPFSFARDLNVGDRTSIQCVVATGDLPLTFTWLKDNVPIETIRTTSREASSNLANGDSIGSLTNKSLKNGSGSKKGTAAAALAAAAAAAAAHDPRKAITIRQNDAFISALSISTIAPAHNGTYTCRVTNGAATVAHSALLHVNVPPRWTVEPIDQDAVVGHGVSIACQAEGFPIPTVTWKQSIGETPGDYRELGYSGTEGAGVAGNGSLVIPRVSRDHAGSYLCQASNGIGPGLSKLIRLTVHAGPQVTVRTRQESVRRGDSVTLRCEAEGDAPLDLSWRVRDSRVDPNYDVRYSIEKSVVAGRVLSELRIMQVSHMDRGDYVCVAGNAYGHARATIHLLVQEPPNFPRNLHVAEQGSRSILLAWSSPQSDQDASHASSPITNYIVQYKEAQDVWHEHNTQKLVAGDNTVALVSPLKPATTYHFRVLAENHLGTSAPSDILHAQTDGEVPGGPPKHVSVEPLGPQQLKITWQPPDRSLWNGELLGYTISYTNLGVDDQSVNTTRVGITGNGDGSYDYRLTGLRKYTQYNIVVKAFNSKGDGPGSDLVTAQTFEDVPSAPPQNVACTALTGQNIQVTWKPPPSDKVHGVVQGYKLLYEAASGVASESQTGRETKISHALSTVLHGLSPYTNYTVQVLAYTKAGEGVSSSPVSCTTEETAPDAPERVKAVASGEDSVVISWLPPRRPNGVLTKYTVFIRVLDQGQEVKISKSPLSAQNLHHEVTGLKLRESYEAWVTASTKIGQGTGTLAVKLQPSTTVPAAIISFGVPIVVPWRVDVNMACLSVGNPRPTVEWRRADVKLHQNHDLGPDNTLILRNVQRNHEGNYSCHVKNSLGSDEITYTLQVQVPPTPPTLLATGTTTDAVQLQWKQGDNGGAPIKGFLLAYRREFAEWEEVLLDRRASTHLLEGLQCGTRYQFTLAAFNKIGSGSASKIETAKTNGSKPIPPSKHHLVKANQTFINLELASWQDGGCPLLYFVVEYRRPPGDWLLVSNNVPPQLRYTVPDLESGTNYELRVTAYNNAGSTQAEYLFTTLSQSGNIRLHEDQPQEAENTPLYLDAHVLAPSVISVLAVILAVAGVCFCLKTHPERSGVVNDPNSQTQVALDNKQNTEQREQYYATVRKPGQQSPPCREVSALKRIPEYPEDIYPYATFNVPEQENPTRQAFFYERSETMLQGAQNKRFQCDVDQYTKVRGRARRKSKSFKSESEEYDTLGSDSDTEVGTSSRTESSNHLDDSGPTSLMARSPGPNSVGQREQRLALVPVHHNVLYISSTSTEPSPISERKTFPRLEKQRSRGATPDIAIDGRVSGMLRAVKLSESGMHPYSRGTSPSHPSHPNRQGSCDRLGKEQNSRKSVESLCLLEEPGSSRMSRRDEDWGSELSTLELKPPTGFTDAHETSEAECDIDMKLRLHRKRNALASNSSLSKSPKDFTITV